MGDDEMMAELEREVPEELRERFHEIIGVTDRFCAATLNREYRDLCREMAALVCQEGTPATRGKAEGWAAGVVYSVGWVNFVTDPSQKPHATAEEIARGCGASPATMLAKAKVVRDGLGLMRMDPDWTLPSKLGDNPLAWLVQTSDGLIADVRWLPRAVQEEAYRRGLIPYLPDDHAG